MLKTALTYVLWLCVCVREKAEQSLEVEVRQPKNRIAPVGSNVTFLCTGHSRVSRWHRYPTIVSVNDIGCSSRFNNRPYILLFSRHQKCWSLIGWNRVTWPALYNKLLLLTHGCNMNVNNALCAWYCTADSYVTIDLICSYIYALVVKFTISV